jgi:SAM-dependent methyltransferase
VTSRFQHEIAHGRRLAAAGAEQIWGWESPAGQLRAARRARLIADAAGLKPGVTALEIGCGTGVFTAAFAGTGATIWAVDISFDLISQARERLSDTGVRFVCAAIEDLRAAGTFDCVIGSSVLHHLDLGLALAQAHRVLRPGGRLAFAEPNLLNPQIAIQKNVPFVKARLGDSPDETAFTRWRVSSELRARGFGQVRVTPFDWLHPSTPRPAIPVVVRTGGWLERLPIVREFAGSLLIEAERM